MKKLAVAILLIRTVANAATYYVTTNGDNTANGSLATPWRTIGKSVAVAVAGDTVNIGPGTYNEFLTNLVSGSAGATITFVGTRGASGEWLTIVNPSTLITNAWVLAPEVGSGIWKQTGMPFATREMTIGGLHIGYVSTNGDMASSILNAYKTNWTTGLEVMGQPTGVSVTNNANFLYGSFWDGIEALYCSTGSVTYLRLRDGSDPSSLTIRCAPNKDSKVEMDVYRPAWDLSGRSFITLSNLDIRGGFAGVKLSTGTHNINVVSNHLDNGWVNIYVIGQAWSNSIVNNSFAYQWYGGPSGSWETDSATSYRKKANQYLICKHLMGSGSEAQRHIYLLGSGSNIVVSGNSLVGGAGNGMNIVETTVVGGIVVSSNSFWQTCSAGLYASKNHVGTLIYANDFRDCNANARFEQDASGTTAISAYIYRNTFWQPDGIGDQIYTFINSTPLAYHPTYWVYHNSMSGGQGCWFVSANTSSAVGMTNTFILNNIFSDGVYVTGSSGWLTTTKIGAWDYNLSTPPNITDPTWFGTHNIKATTNQWDNAEGMSFGISSGSQAVSAALDTSSSFTLAGNTYSALPDFATKFGVGWDMGALEMSTFYVTTNGNNSNDGSQATPWATIDKAISSGGVGATIYVGQGYYHTNATDGDPLNFSTASQTFICSNNVVVSQIKFTASNITLTNANIGYRYFGGAVNDPVCWFKPGSDGSVIGGGKLISAAGHTQWGVLFDGNFCKVIGTEVTTFGPSGVCFQMDGATNKVLNCFIHDNPSVEALFYIWGNYHLIANNIITNNNDVQLPGSHPDLFQSFFATSWGHVISNNYCINNSCQIGSLQAVDGPDGGTYATNAGGWTFVNNVFINQGSKLDVDFRDMKFVNNTFYNCNNNTSEPQVFGFNWSIYGCGTNGIVENNLFALCGADPTLSSEGWFGISEGTNTSNLIRNSLTAVDNMVTGSAYGTKDTNSLYGTGWVNGGSPKFLSANATRIHVLNLSGVTGVNASTNVFGTNASFQTELSIGDYITIGPYWTDVVAQVVRIVNATNLWTDTAIGHGVNTKDGGRQSMQRVQNFDAPPNLRLLYGSPAIDVGATLSYNPYDFDLTNRPVGPAFDIGAFEGPRQPDVPTNMVMWLTFNGWGGGTNVLDVTTNHANAALFLGSTWWPTPATNGQGAPDSSDGVHIGNSQYFGVTNVAAMRNLTNGTIAVWAQRTNGVGNGYGYILDCGFTFPATNGYTLGNDNGLATSLYVTDASHARNQILTWSDFHSTNWHHYAFTWSSSTAVGYYDGVPFQTNAMPAGVLTLDDADWLCVGAIQHDTPPGGGTFPNAAFLLGFMTDVRIYNTALSANDIANVYAVHALPTPPPAPPTPGGGLPPQMLLHYTFASWNGSSNVLDQTTNHADGITYNSNGPTLTNAFTTNAAGHFASGQWLAVTNYTLFEYLTNGTLAMWMKSDRHINTADFYMMDGWYAYPDTNCFSLGAPNAFPTTFKTWKNSGTTMSVAYPDNNVLNTWHHYGMVWDGIQTITYYDGVARATNTQIIPFYHVENSAKWLAIGVQHGSHTPDSPSFGWLLGSMADVRVYNYAQTPANMALLAQFIDPTSPTSPDPYITVQPSDQTVTAPATATFSVTAGGLTALSYQWYTNGVTISGATSSTYTTPATSILQAGLQFYVIVTDTASSLQSDTALLHVDNSIHAQVGVSVK